MPNKAVAGGDGFGGGIALIDSEVKRVGTGTKVRISVNVRVYACGVISHAVP